MVGASFAEIPAACDQNSAGKRTQTLRQHGPSVAGKERPAFGSETAVEQPGIRDTLLHCLSRTFSSSSVNPRPSFVFMLYRIVLPWTIGRSNPFTGRGEIAFALAARAAQLQGRQALRGSATALRASGFVAAPRPAHRRTISSTLLACGLVEPSLHSALPVLVAMHIRDDVVVSRHLEPVLRSISIDAVATTVGFRSKPSTVSLLVPSHAAGLFRPLSRAFPRPSLPSGIERVPSWSRSFVAKAHLPSANTRDVQSRERRRWNPAPLPIPMDPITRRGNRQSRPLPVLGGDGNLGLDPPPTRRHPCEYSHPLANVFGPLPLSRGRSPLAITWLRRRLQSSSQLVLPFGPKARWRCVEREDAWQEDRGRTGRAREPRIGRG